MPEKSPKPNRPENILSRGIARPSIEPQSRSIALSTEMNTGRIEVGSSEKSRNEPHSRDHILRRERKRAPTDQHLEDLKNACKFATKLRMLDLIFAKDPDTDLAQFRYAKIISRSLASVCF